MFIRLKRAGFIFFALASVLMSSASAGLQKDTADKPRLGGTLRVKPFIDVFTPNLDPAKSAYYFVLDQLYDGLVKLDDNGNIIPSLAEYWVISDEGKKFILNIRKGVKFHNGRELTAEDVKFSLERLMRKDVGAHYYQYFTTKVVGAEEFWEGKAPDVVGFKVRDRYTFEIDWKNPYVSGLYLLSVYFCKILPKDLVASQGQSFFMKPSGTGAFKFGYWLRSPKLDIVGVRLERNEEYFGEWPFLDVVEFSPYYTVDQFKNGDVHIMPLPSDDFASGRYQLFENNSPNLFFLGLSCHIPPLDRKDIRQALALALDKKKIAQAVRSFNAVPQILDNYVPASLPGFFPQEDRRETDPDLAGHKLTDAGFPSGRNFPKLILCFILPRTDWKTRIFREIRSRFATLGIMLDMKYIGSLKDIKTLQAPHLLFFERFLDFPDAENIILPLFQSQSVQNMMSLNYSNPSLDKLLAASEVEKSWERRTELFRQMEQILTDDVPAVPLFQLRLRMVLQPYVRGAKAPLLSFSGLDVKDIWLDK